MTDEKKALSSVNVKRLVGMSVFAALAFVCVAVIRVPMISFLKYEPKDLIIAIAAFTYGSVPGVLISLVVSLVEMITISDTGIIGFLMNFLSTVMFVVPGAIIYRHNKKLSSALIGLVVGTLTMTAGMLLWNYIVTPFYMNTPRADVAAMLVPVFLPFNLIKGGINSALCMLLYKRVGVAIDKIGLG